MKKWSAKGVGGRTFIVYAKDSLEAAKKLFVARCNRLARANEVLMGEIVDCAVDLSTLQEETTWSPP